MDVLIVTALTIEADAVRQQGDVKWRSEYDKSSDLHFSQATFKSGVVAALVQLPSMGPVTAAVATTRAIEALTPKRVVLTGIAAGIGEGVALGDILVSDQVIDYDLGKVSSTGLTPRWRGFQVDPALLTLAREGASKVESLQIPDRVKRRLHREPRALKVHFGTILSGSKVVADQRTISELRKTWVQAVGLEMEGGGGAAAAHNSPSRPGFIIIKAVSDRADAAKDDSFREFAASVAALFTIQLIQVGPSENSEGDLREPPPPAEPWIPVDEEGELGLSLIDIKAMLRACFNLAELQDLCSDIGLEWEDLPERDQKSKVIDQIVLTCRRHFKLRALVRRVRDLRPGAFS